VDGVDGLLRAAELLAWFGPMIGLPLFARAYVLRAREKNLVPTQIVIVQRRDGSSARWFTAGDINERRLRASEQRRLAGAESWLAYVSPTDEAVMRLRRRSPVTRGFLYVGATLALIGLAGFIVALVAQLTA
jgi:hypothetical protein